jgi:hypothetical protein
MPFRTKFVSLGRHKRNCSICHHPQEAEIEAEFIAWTSPESIARQYGLSDRATVYRHAHALNLFGKRRRNVRAALERIIERAGDVDVTSSAVVSAIQALAKINAAGQWVDPSERLTLHDLYQRMTGEELENYARDGTLPSWFRDVVSGTQAMNSEVEDD